MRQIRIGAILILALTLQAAAQEKTGSIHGTVSQSGSNTPLANVYIGLVDSQGTLTETSTDSAGKFKFENVAPDTYLIQISRDGFIFPGIYASRVTPTSGFFVGIGVVSLLPGQEVQTFHAEMVATGSLSGRVFNPNGTPESNVSAEAWQFQIVNGMRRFVRADRVQDRILTNDRGEFRLFGLPPGEYIVIADPSQTADPDGVQRITTYFPSATNPESAARVKVESGVDAGPFDIPLRTGILKSISIRVNPAPPENSYQQLFARITPNDPNVPIGPSSECLTGCRFQTFPYMMRNVPMGSYELDVIRQTPEGNSSGHTNILIGPDSLDDVTVNIRNGIDINVGYSFIGNPPAKAPQFALYSFETTGFNKLQEIRHLFYPTFDQANVAAESTTGHAVIPGVVPGRYYLVPSRQDLYISDVRQGGKSVLESGIIIGSEPPEPITFTVGMASGTIRGTVENSEHFPTALCRAVLVPSGSRRKDYAAYKVATTNFAGRFAFDAVAPGEYKVFSWASAATGMWANEEFMQRNEESGVSVTVKPNLNISDVHVTIIP